MCNFVINKILGEVLRNDIFIFRNLGAPYFDN